MGADLKWRRWQAADTYQTSILLCPFCRYAIVHTNHHFARKRESTAMAILLTFFFNWWKNGCVPKGFNQKHAGCRETSGVFCCERGAGFKVQGSGFKVQGCGGGFAEILRLRSQLFWHSLSHMRRFSPLRMTKRGDARKWYVSHKSQVTSHLGLLIPSYSSLVTHSRLQTCGGGFAAC